MYSRYAVTIICVTAIILMVMVRELVLRWLELKGSGKVAPLPLSEKLPGDLFAVAYRESEPWARDQTIAAMKEAYGQSGDWAVVRSQFGVAGLA